jgi:hypothetical protein
MAGLLEVFNQKIVNDNLRNRTIGAVAVAAWSVFAEQSPSAARIAWAKDAVANAEAIGNGWMWAVAGNAAVQAANFNPSDGDIQYIVNSLRDKIAV